MKNILKFGLLACLATAFVFAGCKKDDDDNNGDSGILPKKVSKIVETRVVDGESSDPYTSNFDTDGRLVSGGRSEKSVQYNYSDNAIEEIFNNKGKTTTSVYKVSDGRIVDLDGGKITYSSEGYLSLIDFDEFETEFTIIDGKLTEMESRESEDGKTYSTKYQFTNDNTLNNLNVDLSYFFLLEGICPGYFGKRLKYLPSSQIEVGGDNEITKFTYTYDGDYLTKIIVQFDDNESLICEIFYY